MEGQDVIGRIDALKKELEGLGCEIREDWLGDKGCVVCEIRGKRVIFLDLANSPLEVARSLQRVREDLGSLFPQAGLAEKET